MPCLPPDDGEVVIGASSLPMTQAIPVCRYPVIAGLGMCCGDTPCSVQWVRECDATGGCLDRQTCGGCDQPVFKGDQGYVG